MSKHAEKPSWLTVSQITERLPISKRLVLRELKSGRLRGQMFGTKWLIREDELERYMEERAAAARMTPAAASVAG